MVQPASFYYQPSPYDLRFGSLRQWWKNRKKKAAIQQHDNLVIQGWLQMIQDAKAHDRVDIHDFHAVNTDPLKQVDMLLSLNGRDFRMNRTKTTEAPQGALYKTYQSQYTLKTPDQSHTLYLSEKLSMGYQHGPHLDSSISATDTSHAFTDKKPYTATSKKRKLLKALRQLMDDLIEQGRKQFISSHGLD